jgi:hypothetical protein
MAISEESRHHLYNKLENVLGSEDATVLMEHLPPVGWADVATKRDLDALEGRISARFSDTSFHFERELRLLTWRLLVAMVATMSVLVAVSRSVH